MFYFLLTPILTYNLLLIAAAVIPALVLMVWVYKSDRLERELPSMLWRLVKAGVFSSLIAMVAEWILEGALHLFVRNKGTLYNVILYFVIVAGSEEISKYLLMKRNSWNHPEFNCQYDGVVYAVFVSLGFALWENISYVMNYGFTTALARAVTAIPGHACFGVFMGVFYGIAKRYEMQNEEYASKTYRRLAVIIPIILHGIYDYIATLESTGSTGYFIVFIAIMFAAAFVLVRKTSRNDRFIA